MPARKYPDALLEEAARLREAGLTLREIGRRLGIHPAVVGWHCLKLGADSPDAAIKPELNRTTLTYTRAGRVVRRFSDEEDALLLGLEAEGFGISEIARHLNRRSNSVTGRLMTLARREARREARGEARMAQPAKHNQKNRSLKEGQNQ